jgi:hypothetical protein
MAGSGVAQGDLASLVNNTRGLYPFPSFENTLELQSYPFLNRIMPKNRFRAPGGKDIRWLIRPDDTGAWEWTRPYGLDSAESVDVMVKGIMQFTFGHTHWQIDDREDDLNSGPEQLASIMQERRAGANESAANNIEKSAFDVPDDGNDDLHPHGFPAHIAMGPNGVFTPGFVGQTLRYGDGSSTTTTIANLDRAANPRLRNWAALYGQPDGPAIKSAGFIRLLRRGLRQTQFNPPPMLKDGQLDTGSDCSGYCNETILEELLDWLDAHNQNFGNMLSVAGTPVIANTPIMYVPTLDKTSSTDTHEVRAFEPLYFVNHRKVRVYVLKDRWMQERPTKLHKDSHNIAQTFVDTAFQIVLSNPKYSGFVLHKKQS